MKLLLQIKHSINTMQYNSRCTTVTRYNVNYHVIDLDKMELTDSSSTETMPLVPSTTSASKKGRLKRRCCPHFLAGHWQVLYILFWSTLVTFFTHLKAQNDFDATKLQGTLWLVATVIAGMVLLLYPVLGWMADVHLTRYGAVGASMYLTLIGMILALGLSIVIIAKPIIMFYVVFWIPAGIAIGTSLLGNGLFQTSAIQFGIDQMVEAPSEQLSSFIYWYYWASRVGNIGVFYLVLLLKLYPCTSTYSYLTACLSLMQIVFVLISIITFHVSHRHMNIERLQRYNPIKMVYEVLHYAWTHKYPTNRSAFTYWETNMPSRIDLGKHQYGGPFTTEQVEDTKTLFRVTLLLFSLFGLRTINDTEILSHDITEKCPSINTTSVPYNIIAANTDHLTSLTIVLAIPAYQLLLRPLLYHYTPSMVKKFWIGLVCACLSCIPTAAIRHSLHNNPGAMCDFIYWLALAQVLNGFAYFFIFLTALEFIIAQVPRNMQGLLIGLWYMMDVIRIAIKGAEFSDSGHTIAFTYIQLGLTITSLLVYSIGWFFYKYRIRDNIVNSYVLAADKVEKIIHQRQESDPSITDDIHITSARTSINSDVCDRP